MQHGPATIPIPDHWNSVLIVDVDVIITNSH
jgi:hypothetical protein